MPTNFTSTVTVSLDADTPAEAGQVLHTRLKDALGASYNVLIKDFTLERVLGLNGFLGIVTVTLDAANILLAGLEVGALLQGGNPPLTDPNRVTFVKSTIKPT